MNRGSDAASSIPQEWSDESDNILQPWDSISERDNGCSQISSTSGVMTTAVQPRGTNGYEGSSATSSSTLPIINLPFLERTKTLVGTPLSGLMHYRLVLNVDKEMEACKIQTPFGPIFDITHIKEPQKSLDEEGTNQPDITLSGTGPNGTTTRKPGSRIGGQRQLSPLGQTLPGARPSGPEIPMSHLEYPRGPLSSPVSTTRYRNEFFQIRKSSLAGYGAFALQDLHWGETILVEKALFRANDFTLYDEIDKLTPSNKQELERLHAHITTPGFSRLAAIFRTNSFRVDQNLAGVFLIAARFNHACKPNNNIAYIYDQKRDSIVFTVERDVKADEELTINYGRGPADLYTGWGFVCKCGACASLTAEQVTELTSKPDWN